MLEVGAWLKENGEAIYGTRPFLIHGEGSTKLVENHFGGVNDRGIQFAADDVRFTTKDKYLYILQLGTPEPAQEIVLKSFAQDSIAGRVKIKLVELIGSPEKINWNKQIDGLHLTAPVQIPNTIALVYKTLLEQ